jgi:hypothetical protein
MGAEAVSWFKLETGFPTHPKVMDLTANAFRLHVCALAYAAEHLTDGEIDPRTLRVLAANSRVSRPGGLVKELVKARLWDVNPFETDSYQIHDYGHHQRTKQDVERERELTRDRVRNYRERHGNATGNALRNAGVTPLVTQQSREEVLNRERSKKDPETAPTTPVANGARPSPTYRRAENLIRNGGHALTDLSLTDELRALGITGQEQTTLLALAETLRAAATERASA